MPQLVWAYECHTDMIAKALNLDPLEFRRRNIMREGGRHTTGTPLKDAPVGEVLEHVAARMNWEKPFDRGTGTVRRGRGMAIAIKAVISPTTSVAIVNVNADGSTTLYCGTVDMGQGSDTAMAQMVGEILNIPAESVNVVPRDTDVTPYDMGTLGSRSLFHMGHAVKLAAEEARAKIQALARDLGLPEGTNYSVADLFVKKYGMQAGNIVGTGTYKPDYISPTPGTGLTDNVTPFWMVSGVGCRGRGRYRDRTCAHHAPRSTSARSASRSTRTSAGRRYRAPPPCNSASPCSKRCSSTAARSPTPRSPTTRFPASTTCR